MSKKSTLAAGTVQSGAAVPEDEWGEDTPVSGWEIVPGAPTAAATDPGRIGLMRGLPPPSDKRITLEHKAVLGFPLSRWSFSHWRELGPTKVVSRGTGAVWRFPRNERSFAGMKFRTLTGVGTTFDAALDQMYIDGLLILRRGEIAFETYRGEGHPDRPHLAWSVTKSFVGTLALILAAEGNLDPQLKATEYVPELAGSCYGDATVRQVMDMTIGARFSEDYRDANAEIRDYGYVAGLASHSAPTYRGQRDILSYLVSIEKRGDHGDLFHYMTINTEALAWIVTRAANRPLAELLSEKIWSRIGAEHDAYIHVDAIGTEAGGTGLNTTLRDLARFGEMIRNRGKSPGGQVIPVAAIDAIFAPTLPSEQSAFGRSLYGAALPGWSYRDMWWFRNDRHGAFSARGIFGQAIYIDPVAEMVIARYASMPAAGNIANDPISLPFYDAVADALLGD